MFEAESPDIVVRVNDRRLCRLSKKDPVAPESTCFAATAAEPKMAT